MGSCPGSPSSSVPISNSSGLFPLSWPSDGLTPAVTPPSSSSVRLRRTPPRDVLEAGRSLLLSCGEGCGLTRGGRGLRDRVESARLAGLLGDSDGLTRAGPSDSLSPFRLRLRLLELGGEGGAENGSGAIAASSALGCGCGGRGVGVSSCVVPPGLFPGGRGGLGASSPG